MFLIAPKTMHRENGAGLIMNPGFNLVHWLRVVLLGCVLGLAYVYVSTLFWMPTEMASSVNYSNRKLISPMPPFKLSERPMQKELDEVIETQLKAFRKDDFPKAYFYAASALRAQVSLPAFERMVRGSYPLLVRSSSESFGVSIDNGEIAVVNVGIIAHSGQIRHYQYLLRRERAGWRISGVAETKFEGTTI